MGTSWTADRRLVAVGMAATVVVGFAAAAVADTLRLPDVAVADDWGPGDGLSRWVLGTADPAALVVAASAAPGVVNAQPLFDGTVLVATRSADPSALSSIPGVVSVDPSVSAELSADPTDPYWSSYGWNLENTGSNFSGQSGIRDADLDATAGWASSTGTGEVVAVLDSGYDLDHPDMAGALWSNPAEPCGSVDTDGNGLAGDCNGWDFTRNAPIVDATDSGSHGTSVSGVIAARAGNGAGSAGVAPGVSIMPLVIGSGKTVDVNLGAQAIRYAADHGATVINASWGGPTLVPALQAAVAYAGSKGVLVVASAGNDAVDRDAAPTYPASLPDPAIISVGSSTAADTLSSFSAWGATSVDLMAPGTLVFAPWPDGGYRLVSGTSFSAPETAAAVAMYRSLMPTATAAEVKQALLADTDPVPAFAGRSVSGGRLSLDGLAALGSQQVGWTFTGMTGAPGALSPSLTSSTNLPAGDYTAVLGLGMRVGGQVYALSGQDLVVGGSTRTTDDTGTVAVPLGARGPGSGTLVLAPTTALTEGRYVLTVQLLQDGAPLGRVSAAPLTVATAPAPTTAPTTGAGPTSAPSTGAAPTSGGAPTSAAPTSAAPTATGPTRTAPTSSRPTGSGPTRAAPTSSAPTSSAPTTAGPTTATPTSSGPSTAPTAGPTGAGPTGAAPTTGAGPTTAAPTSRPVPTGTTPTTTAPRTTASPTGASPVPTVPPGGSTVYPGVGDFRVTSVRPNRVDAAGGAAVTVVGTFAEQPRVLVGTSGTATVVSWSATQVVFTAPARVPGTYDLLLSTAGGLRSALPAALTYTSSSGSTGPTSAPSSTASPTTRPVPTAAPTSSGPVVVRGPGGQRLVQTAFFSGLPASLWSMDCSSSCTGTQV
ncbi:S8 family serine peptidase [Klenkia brasiliensis]|uniref:Serine protease, subtilisin family n=1 Tax=Klenkia brasiliensis TaxID=333142 RepID=A0A1G7Q7R5_9ACTN|nr:S8 family serine peptidase [Klenkia brasiliensis]SDF94556.1 Serine protease, subtilisin family [Klenkia brasiliensis]